MPGYLLKIRTLYWKKILEIESYGVDRKVSRIFGYLDIWIFGYLEIESYGVDRKVSRSIEEIESWDPIAGPSPDRLILISPANVLFSAQH